MNHKNTKITTNATAYASRAVQNMLLLLSTPIIPQLGAAVNYPFIIAPACAVGAAATPMYDTQRLGAVGVALVGYMGGR